MSGFYFYDLETSGRDPRWHRIIQFAGVCTDADFVPEGDPIVLEAALPPDVLPEPEAMLVTSITPRMATRGLLEADFIAALERELERPDRCLTGFNNLRFDDEYLRYTLYRNLRDPYAHEWRQQRSRFDLMDLVRAAAALRPEGIEWPRDETGAVSLKLSALASANGIEHAQAHNAASDVLATVALARRLRAAQPRLFAHYFSLRDRAASERLLWPRTAAPVLHVSGRLPRTRRHLALVTPLGRHRGNPRSFYVFDLDQDPEPLADMSDDELVARVFTRAPAAPAVGAEAAAEPDAPTPVAVVEVAEQQPRIAIKEVRVNRVPFLAPAAVLREADAARLGIDVAVQWRRHAWLHARPAVCERIVAALSAHDRFPQADVADVEARLYDGFASDADRALGRELVALSASELAARVRASRPAFADERFGELLFRYRARNFPQTLSSAERARWRSACRERLQGRLPGPLSLAAFDGRIDALRGTADAAALTLLAQWHEYARGLMAEIDMALGTPLSGGSPVSPH